jgi:hypothetical protein
MERQVAPLALPTILEIDLKRVAKRGLLAATKPDDNSPHAPFGGEGPGVRGVAKTLLKKARFYEIAMQSFPSLETLRHVLELQRQSRSLLKAGSLRYLLHIRMENVFQSRVFFLKNLEFITATDAGRITYEETVRFEEIHERVYRHLGFEITMIDRGSVSDRVKEVKRTLLTHASFESLPKTGG